MKIIKPRQYFSGTSYQKVYGVKPDDMHYSFKCDENGEVDESTLHPSAVENYNACKNGSKSYKGKLIEFLEVRVMDFDGYEAAIGICDVCESKVELSNSMTNTCDCGAEYNASGQRLEDRHLWDGTDGATSPDYE